MEYLIFVDKKLTYRGQYFNCSQYYIEGDACIVNLTNSDNDIMVIFVANETTINDVLQTSADMILQTLSNG